MEASVSQSALFLMPRSSTSWRGAEAIWVTVAGWALAAEKVLGEAKVLTTDRVADPIEVWEYPLSDKEAPVRTSSHRFLPLFLRVFLKDVRQLLRRRSVDIHEEMLEGKNVRFIWEQHDLFPGNAKRYADKYRIPLVKYVHAPVVWESEKWGVKRYGWGKILERMEGRSLKRADIVLVVSEEVKKKVLDMGVSENKLIISPMGVTPELFAASTRESKALKEHYRISESIVLGWVGSFRKFHGVEQLIKAFYNISGLHPSVYLVLIGEGGERKMAERLVSELNLKERVIFTGRIPYKEIPAHISMFDIALVSAENAEGFHYSPLKLREYMAAGKPVLAPNAGEIPEKFIADKEIKLFEPGVHRDLEQKMEYLIENGGVRKMLADNGKDKILKSGNWETELKKVLHHIEK